MKNASAAFVLLVSFVGCASPKATIDSSLVAIEAVVVSYGQDQVIAHGENFRVDMDYKYYATHLEALIPNTPYDRRLTVALEAPLKDDHPLRQIGAIVTFATDKKYLSGFLSDLTKPHDSYWLTLERMIGLKKKEPNQSVQPTPGSVTPCAIE
jgi:hypothetical protein